MINYSNINLFILVILMITNNFKGIINKNFNTNNNIKLKKSTNKCIKYIKKYQKHIISIIFIIIIIIGISYYKIKITNIKNNDKDIIKITNIKNNDKDIIKITNIKKSDDIKNNDKIFECFNKNKKIDTITKLLTIDYDNSDSHFQKPIILKTNKQTKKNKKEINVYYEIIDDLIIEVTKNQANILYIENKVPNVIKRFPINDKKEFIKFCNTYLDYVVKTNNKNNAKKKIDEFKSPNNRKKDMFDNLSNVYLNMEPRIIDNKNIIIFYELFVNQ